MKRRIRGLAAANARPAEPVASGVYLVRLEGARYRWSRHCPGYEIDFVILEPRALAGVSFSVHLPIAGDRLWRLAWLLRDFGYDQEKLSNEEIEERAMVGLSG